MTGHCTDDDLVLYYYAEARRPGRIDRHLDECDECAAEFRALSTVLDAVVADVPPRGDRYGLEVWQRIRHDLPLPDGAPWPWLRRRSVALSALAAVALAATLVSVGLVRTRISTRPFAVETRPGADTSGADRARFAAIGDHLEQSERVLLELLNAGDGAVELSTEQAWAEDLIAANRLYRESALAAGDDDVALVLDDLERRLLDIVHEPSALTHNELDGLELRLGTAALLFKLRVLADELREREEAPRSAGAQDTTT